MKTYCKIYLKFIGFPKLKETNFYHKFLVNLLVMRMLRSYLNVWKVKEFLMNGKEALTLITSSVAHSKTAMIVT